MKTENETLVVRRRVLFTVARDSREYTQSISPTEDFMEKLHRKRVDIFSFLERKWCCPISNPARSWAMANDNIAILHLSNYEDWWRNIGKKTRNMIRKAEKGEIKTEIAVPDEKLAEGMLKIYNETPIRQERAFPHFGISLTTVRNGLFSMQNCTHIGAYLHDELVGFVQLLHGDNITIISQILSLQKYREKAVNNALVAKIIEVCANRNEEWIMYGRMGNHPTLDNFKENNGFMKFQLTRFFIPLTRKGKLAIKLGLHRELKETVPQAMKRPLFPIYNWVSRTRMRIKLLLR